MDAAESPVPESEPEDDAEVAPEAQAASFDSAEEAGLKDIEPSIPEPAAEADDEISDAPEAVDSPTGPEAAPGFESAEPPAPALAAEREPEPLSQVEGSPWSEPAELSTPESGPQSEAEAENQAGDTQEAEDSLPAVDTGSGTEPIESATQSEVEAKAGADDTAEAQSAQPDFAEVLGIEAPRPPAPERVPQSDGEADAETAGAPEARGSVIGVDRAPGIDAADPRARARGENRYRDWGLA
jgi:hypothetical protein